MEMDAKIGFIGTGKMATALVKGFVKKGVLSSQIFGIDPLASARRAFETAVGARTLEDLSQLACEVDVIFIAVKPDKVEEVLVTLDPHLSSNHLIISIAAGISLQTLENNLTNSIRVIRAMPNAPALVGAGAAGFALGKCATQADSDLAKQLLSAVGLAFCVSESLLDAITGLSGSSPAFVCQVIESLSDGGVATGLSREMSIELAAQTVMGTAKMILEMGQHPAVLKDAIASPGGTTIEGLRELEKGALRAALMNAVCAATAKSKRLGRRNRKRNRF